MKHGIRRGLTAASLAVVSSIALAACSAPAAGPDPSADFEPITSIKLQLQWLPQAQFAGYYVALDQGYFEEVASIASKSSPLVATSFRKTLSWLATSTSP